MTSSIEGAHGDDGVAQEGQRYFSHNGCKITKNFSADTRMAEVHKRAQNDAQLAQLDWRFFD